MRIAAFVTLCNDNPTLAEKMARSLDLLALAHSLHDRRDGLTCHNIGHIFEDYLLRKGRCHENVRCWVEVNPDDQRIFGWFVDRSAEAQTGVVKFIAHSIVLTAAGEYLDVTMACGEAAYPFLTAEMIEADFDAVAAEHAEIDLVVDDGQLQTFVRGQNDHLAGPW